MFFQQPIGSVNIGTVFGGFCQQLLGIALGEQSIGVVAFDFTAISTFNIGNTGIGGQPQ